MRRAILAVLLLVAVGLVAVTVAVGQRTPSDTERVAHLAGELRCPTCVSQTVADSDAPVASGMRAEVARQVAAGRSDAQILDWFKSRYGAGIVLVPSRDGAGPLLWSMPAVVLLAGGGLAAWRWRRRTRAPAVPSGELTERQVGEPQGSEAPVSRALPPGRLALVLGLVLASGVATSLAFTGQHHAGTASASASSPPASPGSAASSSGSAPATDPVAAAFALLQQGQPVAAEALVRGLVSRPGKVGTLALLVLGLAQRAAHDPAAGATLQRFVREHPHHPAAAQVRRLLSSGPGSGPGSSPGSSPSTGPVSGPAP